MHKSLHSRQYNDFLDQLRQLRLSRGLRQSDLAARLGRAQSLVSRAESGERRLDVVELWVWLQALEMDLSTFARELDERLRGG
jgi:transcriptional regulator with XRE-family HTH domain